MVNPKNTFTQKDIFAFDSTSTATVEIISTTETFSQKQYLNPFYSCKCRRGYSLFSDPFNTWKKQEEYSDYSRSDIAKAFRLGREY